MQGSIKLFLALIILTMSQANASLKSDYYPNHLIAKFYSGKLENKALKDKLYESISEQRSDISYKEARQFMFGKIYLKKSGKEYFVEDAYCEKTFDTQVGVGPGKIPDSKFINCEHTWPQSRFSNEFPKHLQKNDLHHLFPVDSRANSSRSNHIFAEVNGHEVNETCTTSFRGRAIGSTTTAFEPPPAHRGNVARALFYFSVRYKINIGPLEEEYLREWHESDPVDGDEMRRNGIIQQIQGNRNPFVDEPDLVDSISNF